MYNTDNVDYLVMKACMNASNFAHGWDKEGRADRAFVGDAERMIQAEKDAPVQTDAFD